MRIANEIAAEGGALVAGNICNTWAYDPSDPEASGAVVRAQYEEQLGWAVEEGVDFVIAETNDYLGEALIGLEVCQELGLPAMVTFASVQASTTYDGYDYVEACRILADRGATVVGLNCSRGPETMLPLLERIRAAVDVAGGGAAGPVPHLAGGAGLRVADRRRRPARVPDRARALPVHALRDGGLRASAPATSASTTSASAAAARPHHVRAMAEALGRTTPASRYSPAIDLHPVLGDADEPHGAHGRLGRRGRLTRRLTSRS